MPTTIHLKGNADIDSQTIHNTLRSQLTIPAQSKIRVKYFDCDFEPVQTEQYNIDALDTITLTLSTADSSVTEVCDLPSGAYTSPINLCNDIQTVFNSMSFLNPAPDPTQAFFPLSWRVTTNSDNKTVFAGYNAGAVRPEKYDNDSYWSLNNMSSTSGDDLKLTDPSLAGFSSSKVNYPNNWLYDQTTITAVDAADHVEMYYTATNTADSYGWEIDNANQYSYGKLGSYVSSGVDRLDGDVVTSLFTGDGWSLIIDRADGTNELIDALDLTDFIGFRHKNVRMNAGSRMSINNCQSQYFDSTIAEMLGAAPISVKMVFSTKKLAHYLGFTDTEINFHDSVTSTNPASGDKVNTTGFIILEGLGNLESFDASPDSKGSKNIVETFKVPDLTYHVTLESTPVEYLDINNYSPLSVNDIRVKFVTDTQVLTFRGTPSLVISILQ